MAPTVATPISESSNITDFVVTNGNGVKGLSEMGLKTLPKQYIQPVEERITVSNILPQESIPIIDMSNWDEPKVSESICDAAEKWGFFQIINHGVSIEVLENVKDATHRFFNLPAEEKRKFSKENSPSNSVRFGTSFSPEAEKALEWKDYLSLFYVSEDEASALWPSACKDQVLEYMRRSDPVIQRLLEALMKRIHVKEIDETKESLLMGSKRINLNYYPVCPNPELTVGVGRHSDVSTLTILLQDDIGGLYVRGNNDSWVHVPPVSGSLVINVGDALQIMSNGRYKSIEHRVIASGSKNRISVPIFVNPRPCDMIGPFSEVLAGGEKALYKQVLYSDYVKHFFRKAHDGKNTIEFAKI
ncbi:feruloyl CoA ortho-hydroxylase F6H1-3-like [Castanea sativa]|uniref:feruloyl CoA ortho-hydroxylase F6H1-3-like n=1 Tax=Castanea sativa TaxID=21020 RepID=UPI003F64DDF5